MIVRTQSLQSSFDDDKLSPMTEEMDTDEDRGATLLKIFLLIDRVQPRCPWTQLIIIYSYTRQLPITRHN